MATTRAALPTPVLTNTPDIPRDVLALANAVDNELGAPSTTSTTRPVTGNYLGRLLFETDTKALIRYSGTVWEYVTPLDTGWVNVTPVGGFTVMGGSELPRVRKIGNQVFMKGGWQTTGMSINTNYTVGQLASTAYYPLENDIRPVGSSAGTAQAHGFVQVGGEVVVRVGAVVGGYYKFHRNWLVD